VKGEEFWTKFKILAQELSNMLKLKSEARKAMLESPLPDVLYHATSPVDVQRIQESKIIKPGFSEREEDRHRLFFSDSVAYSIHVVMQTKKIHPREIKFFKLRTSGLPRGDFLSMLEFEGKNGEPTHEVAYEGLGIPIDNLELMSDEEVRTQFQCEAELLEEEEKSKSKS